MKNLMGGPVNPQEMMQNMMGGMSSADKVACMREMMPKCMSMMFSQLPPEQRVQFAKEMMGRMFEEVKGHAAETPDTASEESTKKTGQENSEAASKGRGKNK